MGGFGSGGHNVRYASAIEYNRRLDAGRMRKKGAFKPGFVGRWQWKSDDGEVNWVGITYSPGILSLRFRYRVNGGEWQSVSQDVSVIDRDCPMGGKTSLFLCPRCAAIRKHLYGAGPRFLCRACHGLTYLSRRERDYDRKARQARNIRRELGAEIGLGAWIGPKPKHMRQATFDTKVLRIRELEQATEAHLLVLLDRMEQRRRPVKQRSRSRW